MTFVFLTLLVNPDRSSILNLRLTDVHHPKTQFELFKLEIRICFLFCQLLSKFETIVRLYAKFSLDRFWFFFSRTVFSFELSSGLASYFLC